MHLYQRKNGYWYIRFSRGIERSTKTTDAEQAREILQAVEMERLQQRLVQLNDPGMSLDRFRQLYVHRRKNELDPDTVRADDLALRRLADVVSPQCDLCKINAAALRRFKTVYSAKGLKRSSINTYLRHIKAALRSAASDGYIEQAPKIEFLRSGRKLPQIIALEHLPFILDYAYINHFEMWRIIRFAMWTGCRREEILSVRREHCVERNGALWLTVTGKGNRQRTIYLLDDAQLAMEPAVRGRVFFPFNKDTVSKYFKRIVRACGFGQYKFHNLRHTAGTQMLASGIAVPIIQKILGHADLSTTMIYAQVLDNQVASEMQRLRY